MVATTNKPPRGAFLLLEGVDRCGKTTQGRLLLNKLIAAGMAATAMRFPDRTTATGTVINNYLTTAGTDLDDRAIHLLFSANRWEAVGELSRNLRAGTNVVCDRYAYSGVAFSTSKVDEVSGKQLLPMEWCQAPDRGLPAPDCVIFLDLSQEEAEKRGGYGGERYEKRDMQIRVRERFGELQKMDEGRIHWEVVDASQTIEEVESDIWRIATETMERISEQGKPLNTMWEDGQYDLAFPEDKEN